MTSLSDEIQKNILSKLTEIATSKKRERELAFFKYKVTNILGTGIKPMRYVVARMMGSFKKASEEELLDVVTGLVNTGIYEAQLAAVEILYLCRERFNLGELFDICADWIDKGILDNWATVDNAAKYVMGYAVMQNPELYKVTYRWTKSDNCWLRRASLVTYIIPAREGNAFNIILKTAKKLMNDNDAYVLKAIGWVLRELGKTDKLRLENFIFKYGCDMARITLRSAIENFPEEERDFLMEQTKKPNYMEECYRKILMDELGVEDGED